MTIRTITKFACFVISLLFCETCTNVSFGGSDHAQIGPHNAGFKKAEIIARISSKEINESSGLAVSKCQQDLIWTHNDSGDGPFIYAINSNGESLGTFRLPNVNNVDWEDIATIKTNSGECLLYIGEIGDNERKRDIHAIYRIKEPIVADEVSVSSRKDPVITSAAEILRFSYSDGRHNSEALMVDPLGGDIYVVTKEFAGPASVFRIAPKFAPDEVQTAPKIARISLPATPNGLVTGGDISPDGKHIVLCDYFAGYELLLSPTANDLSSIWDQKPEAFDLGPREIGEAVAFGQDAETLYATTERLNAPLIRVLRENK
ncbi:MAG: hypothetical protein DMF62_06680 [Acidobacteria bacterium]|nr:MAG: hypothetical protein DMF62_06680 [Acidobacteriota bacterium]